MSSERGPKGYYQIDTLIPSLISLLYSLRPEKGSFANPLVAKLVSSVAICKLGIFDSVLYLFTNLLFFSCWAGELAGSDSCMRCKYKPTTDCVTMILNSI